MSRISYWRLYLAARVDTDNSGYVEITEFAAKQLLEDLAENKRHIVPIVSGREPNIRTSRTFYVALQNVVALEPRDD
jgi:hypothetical protein